MAFSSQVLYSGDHGYPSPTSFELAWQDTGGTYCIKNFGVSTSQTVIFSSAFCMSNRNGLAACSFRICNTGGGVGMMVVIVNGRADWQFRIAQMDSFGQDGDPRDGTGTALVSAGNMPLNFETWFRMEIIQTVNSSGISHIVANLKQTDGTLIQSLNTDVGYVRGDYCGFASCIYGQGNTNLLSYYDDITVQAIGTAPQYVPPPPAPAPPPSGGGGGGCVAVGSFLPDGMRAGEVQVEDSLLLGDDSWLTSSYGIVSYSELKPETGFRITTGNGVTLVASSTARIPTLKGLVLAPNLLGSFVGVYTDKYKPHWEPVVSVENIGPIEVQHITVGDKSFWAGEKPGEYILHHNLKVPE